MQWQGVAHEEGMAGGEPIRQISREVEAAQQGDSCRTVRILERRVNIA